MRSYYRVYMKGIMARDHKQRLGGTQKGRKAQKEKVVHPMRPRNMKIKSKLVEKERLITWKVNSKK